MLFWMIAGILNTGCALILIRTLFRGRTGDVSAASYDLEVYRQQLAEIDRDVTRGVMNPEEAERTRTEVARRILEADTRLKGDTAQGAGKSGSVLSALLIAVVAVMGSLGLYFLIGAPGYPDIPLSARHAAAEEAARTRLSQSEVESRLPATASVGNVSEDYAELMAKLRETVAQRPDDLEGLTLLARNEAALGNFRAAHLAQGRILTLRGEAATATDYADYADMLITAAEGYVSQEANLALREALARNPNEPRARYYAGVYFLQIGRPDRAFRLWSELLKESRAGDPWTDPIRAQIEAVAEMAGVTRFTLPPLPSEASPGPSADDIEAAAELSQSERDEMVLSMVSRLSERLAEQGGSAEEWARLINALGVLGQRDRARAIFDEAQTKFAGDEAAQAKLRSAAKNAGVAN